MKHFTLLTLLFLLAYRTTVFAQCACATAGCDFTIEPGMPNYDFYADELKAAMGVGSLAGKTICIKGGPSPYTSRIQFRYVEGTASAPVTIKNCDGVAVIDAGTASSILLWDSRYIRLLGNTCSAAPDNIKYGIRAKSGGSFVEAKALTERITDIEIAYLNIGGDSGLPGGAGIKIFGLPGCDEDTISNRNSSQRKVIRNVLVHDNYIHNVGNEGTYIGHGAYFGEGGHCSNPDIKSYSVSLKGVRIYNNIIENTGWDGLQLKDADSDVKVYRNDISNYGLLNKSSQNEGMVIGTCVGEFYHNRIITGTGSGFFNKGLGNLNIHNNIISNSGEEGMYLNGLNSTAAGTNDYLRIVNNTIVKTGQEGVWLLNYSAVTNRVLVNNIIAEVAAASSVVSGSFTQNSNNLENRDAAELDFVSYQESTPDDFSSNDYHLQQSSDAVDAGMNASVFGADSITYDYDGTPRNYNGSYDIGAYEYDGQEDPGQGDTPWALYINAAGTEYSDTSTGETRLWEADTPHNSLDNSYPTFGTGGTASFSGANPTSAPKQVLGSYRYTLNTGTTIRYNIPVPVSGATYDVELFFARKNADTYGSGERRFNIIIEGQTVTTYDVYDHGGAGGTGASSYSYSTAVNDGFLELKFVAVGGSHSQINAIVVKKQTGPDPNPTETISLFINSGGYEFDDGTQTWEADTPHPTLDTSLITYGTGGTASFSGDNSTMAPDEVLGTNRNTLTASNTIRYKIPVPGDGDYEVELFFARKTNETYTSGGRRFDIKMEGSTVTTYDIYDHGGPDGSAASSYLHTVTVNDDTLELSFVAASGSRAQINAIRVEGPVDGGSLMRSQTVNADAQDQNARKVDVYPNPAIDHIDINLEDKDVYRIRIISPENEAYFTSVVESNGGELKTFDISDLPDRQMYILQVQSSKGIQTFKIYKAGR